MGCLAQIVNVLQSVILTDEDKMLLTPTYHVFHMYRFHQDADLLDSYLEGSARVGQGEDECDGINESVSVDKDGIVTITLNNVDAKNTTEVDVDFRRKEIEKVEGFILTGNTTDYNTFEKPDTVCEKNFDDFEFSGVDLKVKMPPCSCVTLRVSLKK
jgi:alpha-N-arabinofuranosidase